jgi:hypothetical protein
MGKCIESNRTENKAIGVGKHNAIKLCGGIKERFWYPIFNGGKHIRALAVSILSGTSNYSLDMKLYCPSTTSSLQWGTENF